MGLTELGTGLLLQGSHARRLVALLGERLVEQRNALFELQGGESRVFEARLQLLLPLLTGLDLLLQLLKVALGLLHALLHLLPSTHLRLEPQPAPRILRLEKVDVRRRLENLHTCAGVRGRVRLRLVVHSLHGAQHRLGQRVIEVLGQARDRVHCLTELGRELAHPGHVNLRRGRAFRLDPWRREDEALHVHRRALRAVQRPFTRLDLRLECGRSDVGHRERGRERVALLLHLLEAHRVLQLRLHELLTQVVYPFLELVKVLTVASAQRLCLELTCELNLLLMLLDDALLFELALALCAVGDRIEHAFFAIDFLLALFQVCIHFLHFLGEAEHDLLRTLEIGVGVLPIYAHHLLPLLLVSAQRCLDVRALDDLQPLRIYIRILGVLPYGSRRMGAAGYLKSFLVYKELLQLKCSERDRLLDARLQLLPIFSVLL